jgi:DNA adenine methylase
MSPNYLKAPFPYFGGKSMVASIVWQRFGTVTNYIEPFFGSGAVLFGKPLQIDCVETINDKDGLVCNVWRAIQRDADKVAEWADCPVNENELHARHIWIVQQLRDLSARLEGDPNYYDVRMAGYWVYGMCSWIGSEFCSGKGPWNVVDGRLVRVARSKDLGVQRQLPHLGNAGQGVNCRWPHLGNAGRGVRRTTINIYDWFDQLSQRLKHVRVCCGDWSRIVTPAVIRGDGLKNSGITGIFLDPPYTKKAERDNCIYRCDSDKIGHDVFEWAVKNGDNPRLRIAVCGYEGEYNFPESWVVHKWVTNGGLSNQSTENSNRYKERVWFSPYCKNDRARPSLGLRK